MTEHAKELLEKAKQEPSKVDLQSYVPVMQALHEKGWTLREIASWLSTKGIPISYSQVWLYLAGHEKVKKAQARS